MISSTDKKERFVMDKGDASDVSLWRDDNRREASKSLAPSLFD